MIELGRIGGREFAGVVAGEAEDAGEDEAAGGGEAVTVVFFRPD